MDKTKLYKLEMYMHTHIRNWILKTTVLMLKFTLTTSFAASSADNPLQALAAISDERESHMPSEAIISLPPALESYITQPTTFN